MRHSRGGGRDPNPAGSDTQIQIELGNRPRPAARDEEVSVVPAGRTSRCSMHSSRGFSDQSHHNHGSQETPPGPQPTQVRQLGLGWALSKIRVVVTPISVIVVISLLIALVEPLKALFVNVESGPSWKGPDGKPPLAFVIDTGSSIPRLFPVKVADGSFGNESQVDRRNERTLDIVLAGCVVRSDGRQTEP